MTPSLPPGPGREPAPPAPDAELVLGRYRLGAVIGRGGFGVVHRALDERLDREVAVKLIAADGPAPERAQREALAAARLSHPAVVAVLDAGEEEGRRVLVSELVQGRSLAELLREGRPTDRDVLRIALALADGLGHAHARGVVHRDVKPQNVMVPDRPASARAAAKITDFGIAHLAGDEPLTRTGDVVGTFAYMAPEQAAGDRVDGSADLYALALVTYEALSGRNPVRGATPAATVRNVGRVQPSLGRERPDLPEELVDAIDRALLPDPLDRGTVGMLADALADALGLLAEEETAPGFLPSHPVERRRRSLPAPPPLLLRLVGALLSGVAAAGLLQATVPDGALPPALAGAGASAACVLAPRLGWLLGAAVLALAVGVGRGAGGDAILVLVAAAPVPVLLRRAPSAWSVAILAPLLAVPGLALAFVPVAGGFGRPARRAAVAGIAAWWVVVAEALTGRPLLQDPSPVARVADHGLSAQAGIELVSGSLLVPGVAVLVVAWAVGATLAPWLLRGRSLRLDVPLAGCLIGALGAAMAVAETMRLGEGELVEPRGIVGAALLAWALLVLFARWRPTGAAWRGTGSDGRAAILPA